jgi:hypothetical protein
MTESSPATTPQEPTTPPETPPAAVQQIPEGRDVTIHLPMRVTDEQLDMALSVGSMACESILHGGLVTFFPTTVMDPKTKERKMAIGHAQMPLISASDTQRIVKLIQAITQVNLKVIEASRSKVPGDHLAAALDADTAKDNLTRDAVAQAEGHAGGIIVAT